MGSIPQEWGYLSREAPASAGCLGWPMAGIGTGLTADTVPFHEQSHAGLQRAWV